MGFYEDHLNAVRKRWQKSYEESNHTAADFKKQATVILKSYGWEDKEIEYILKDVK